MVLTCVTFCSSVTASHILLILKDHTEKELNSICLAEMRSQIHIWAHTLKPRCFWLYRSIFLKCVANYLYSSLSPCCAEHDSFPSSTHCLSGKWVECVWNSSFFKKEKINQCSHFGGNFNEIQQWDLPITTSCRQGTDVAAFLQTQKIEVSARAVRVPHRQLCDEGRERENIPSDDCYRTDLIGSCLSTGWHSSCCGNTVFS